MTIAQVVQDYGYSAVLAGTFLEGETILILGGLAAHLGYLSLQWVIVCGFAGSLLGDQLFFLLGRRHGQAILARFPSWKSPSERAFAIMERHQNILIVSFRFLYGLRTVTPLALGISNVSYLRFAILNLIGAAIWAVVIAVGGFYFGQVMESVIGNVKRYELALAGAVVGIAMLAWLFRFYRQRRRDKAESRNSSR
jgi:membrane protein DedA with SNARE-associated domain